ncbi:MAG: hypothetical protein J7497_17275, partial [Chitinophagaceae bacterium]|nr:hypothetical protein [Chitinophagaceae bacterium]
INFARQMSGPKTVLNPVLSIVVVFFMYGSLWYFFCQSWEETDNTFVQTVPLISLAVYLLCSLSLIINSIIQIRVLSHQQGLRG